MGREFFWWWARWKPGRWADDATVVQDEGYEGLRRSHRRNDEEGMIHGCFRSRAGLEGPGGWLHREHASRKSPGRLWGFGLEQQKNKGLRRDNTKPPCTLGIWGTHGTSKEGGQQQPGGTGAEIHSWESASRSAEHYLSPRGCSGRMGRVKRGSWAVPSRLKTSKGRVKNSNLLRNGQKGRKSSRSLWHHWRQGRVSRRQWTRVSTVKRSQWEEQ